MSFFGGMPQYYEMRNDPLNRPGTMPMTKIDPREAMLGDLLPRAAGVEYIQEQMQGPRQYNPLLIDHNPMNDPRLNSAGLANIHPDVAAAVYGRQLPGNAAEMMRGLPAKPNLGLRAGETADGVIRQEIMRRRRR